MATDTSRPAAPDRENLRARIRSLEREIEDLTARLPAHSVSPAMLARLEELEEELVAARAALGLID